MGAVQVNGKQGYLKEHEKLVAFLFLGFGVLFLAVLSLLVPKVGEVETVKQLLVAAMGALTLALGSATNALFRIKDQSELDTAQVVKPENGALPVVETPVNQEELPDYARN